MLISIFFVVTPWRRRQNLPPKLSYLPTSPHGVTTREVSIDLFIAARTPNFTQNTGKFVHCMSCTYSYRAHVGNWTPDASSLYETSDVNVTSPRDVWASDWQWRLSFRYARVQVDIATLQGTQQSIQSPCGGEKGQWAGGISNNTNASLLHALICTQRAGSPSRVTHVPKHEEFVAMCETAWPDTVPHICYKVFCLHHQGHALGQHLWNVGKRLPHYWRNNPEDSHVQSPF
jgi:hypothetical protein